MKTVSRNTFGTLLTLAFAVAGFTAAPVAKTSDRSVHNLPTAPPAEVGVDAEPLIYLSKWLRQDKLDVRSLLVVKDGKLIFERYTNGLDRDYNYELYSDTKGISAVLAGILIDEGKLHLDDRVASLIAKLRPDLAAKFNDKKDIEVRHLLTMSTGLDYSFKKKNTGDPIYYGTPDKLKLAADTPSKIPPGKRFEYTDINAVLMAGVLRAAAGKPVPEFAKANLFKPLGMKNYFWGRTDEKGLVSTGWGLRLRAMDMAKIGLLMLNDGQWKGDRIVSQNWVEQMHTPAGIVPDFGYDWWINTIVKTEPEYSTIGYKGQYILVLPKRDAVVAMTSLLPKVGSKKIFKKIVSDYILPALDGKKIDEALDAKLAQELNLSKQSRPEPGAKPDPEFTDTPRKPHKLRK